MDVIICWTCAISNEVLIRKSIYRTETLGLAAARLLACGDGCFAFNSTRALEIHP
jgi:hypothetical protein